MPYKITSLTNKIWNIANDAIADVSNILPILQRNRNIQDLDKFLNSRINSTMPDPYIFIDLEKAANRIKKAIENDQQITILGDYDVDGISSTALLINFFNHIDIKNNYVIPNRMEDGYGVNIAAIEKYKNNLIIAVDCGANSTNELKYAKDNNIDVIVIDHHKMNTISDDACAIINPHRPDEVDAYKYLCAAGLVFMCIIAVNRLLRESGFYKNIEEPKLFDYLDLVALATVCDVVNLIELNRCFVSAGLQVITNKKNIGLTAIMEFGKNRDVNSGLLAFFLGPRINASGRIARADIGVELLTTKDLIKAQKLAQQLEDLNKTRQSLEQVMLDEANSLIDEKLNFICLFNEKWHVGIMGIIAGRLKEKYQKPTIIIAPSKDGISKGSCRSIDVIDISSIIRQCIEEKIIISGGGHALAAGFSIKTEQIPELIEFLKNKIKYCKLDNELYADCSVNESCLSIDFIDKFSMLEPFGAGNRSPRFVLENLCIMDAKIVGAKHIASALHGVDGQNIRAISFSAAGTELEKILSSEKRKIKALGSLSINHWNGTKNINLLLEDVALHDA